MRNIVALLVLAAPILGGCASTSGGAESSVPVSARADGEYAPVLEKWYRETFVSPAFQKRFEVKAVLLTNEFRKAYLARHARLQGPSQGGQFDDSIGSRVGVLLSVFSSDRDFEILEDKRLWTIAMNYGQAELRNPEVRMLPEKALTTPYFPFVSPWSKEFLVVFEPQGGEGGLPDKVELTMRSSMANVEMIWK
jgi:hypothetical protein